MSLFCHLEFHFLPLLNISRSFYFLLLLPLQKTSSPRKLILSFFPQSLAFAHSISQSIIMRFSTVMVSLMAMAAGACAQVATTAGYDPNYDTSSLSTLSITCSDGTNGLNTKGYQTLGDLPGFPRVGAIETIAQWNSPNCGKCYKVTYTTTGASINIIGVDRPVAGGIVMSLAALNELTGGQGTALGRVDVTYLETAGTDCGYPA